MRHFVDSIKTGEPEKPEAKDKSGKKHKKKKRHRENPEETAEKPEAQMEVDDLDRFISAVVQTDQKASLKSIAKQPAPVKHKGPHHNGPFITGEFLSESTNNKQATHLRPPTEAPIAIDEVPVEPV